MPDEAVDPLAEFHAKRERLEIAKEFMDPAAYRVAYEKIQAEIASYIQTSGGAYIEGTVNTAGGAFIGRDQVIIHVDGKLQTDSDTLRTAYLNHVFETVSLLQLSGIDPKAASEKNAALSLAGVYTALLTERASQEDQPGKGRDLPAGLERGESRRISALEELERSPRLVLLGDPGSGKSTFVNFAALCLAGEGLGGTDANLALLTQPLPVENQRSGQNEEPKAQPWSHGALLPLRVVLRDFAARGLPPAGEKATAAHLWDFIAAELTSAQLGDFAPALKKELREQGGLLLVDGLDEVPEAGQRRVQIKQAVEDFTHSHPKLRVLVTSRTYAYQKQDWRLRGFEESLLAPFNRGQIGAFVEHWYAQVASARNMNRDDAQGRATLLKNAIFASERLLGLAERPLLLTLMASLHAWRGGTLPDKREELYADTVDLLLDWWEQPKTQRDSAGKTIVQDPSLAEWLKVDRAKVRGLLERLAYEAHAAQPDLNGTADIKEDALVAGLMKLSNNLDLKPARLLEYLRDRTGLLLPRGEGVYTFPHRTFQEYLAACWLTGPDYPEKIAELACADFNRWREVALLAGAKAGRGTAAAVWTMVDALCYADTPAQGCGADSRLWGAHLAAQALAESGDLETISPRNQLKLERVRAWLAHILAQSALPARERALAGSNLARLGDPRPEVMTLEWMRFCFVPGGPFRMGEGKGLHIVKVDDFWLGQHPVSQAQYRLFVEAGGYAEARYWPEAQAQHFWTQGQFEGRYDDKPRSQPMNYGGDFSLSNHPVVGLSWYEALAFTRWLTEQARSAGWLGKGSQFSLPSEAEWEKAARGGSQIPAQASIHALKELSLPASVPSLVANPLANRLYPWGDGIDVEHANYDETQIAATSALGSFAHGASPYGIEDLSGNVWEWTRSVYKGYSYNPDDGRENLNADADQPRVLRGGAWCSDENYARCASRSRSNPNDRNSDLGFRVVLCPSLPSVL
jgi:formylglycine-generating enzyme required for sulfatase activity